MTSLPRSASPQERVAADDIHLHRISVLRVSGLLFVAAALLTRPAHDLADWLWVALELMGAFLVLAAVIGRFWAILHVGGRKSAEVVRSGPYSVCRHPLYLFSLMGIAGICVMEGSLVIATATMWIAAVIFLRTAAAEEEYLHALFPDTYTGYAALVPRLLPSLGSHNEGNAIALNTGALAGNFRDALIFLLAIPASEVFEAVNESALLPTIAVP